MLEEDEDDMIRVDPLVSDRERQVVWKFRMIL